MADVTSTVEYYKNLLLYQYQSQQKAPATIEVLIRQALCDLVPLDVRDAFNIETAIGAQLDILGKYIGFARRVLTQPDRDYFRMANYEDPLTAQTGFTDYAGGVNLDSVFYKYSMAYESFSDLEDEEYRTLLKMKIMLNATDNTLANIAGIMFEFFGTDLVCYDLKDMTISYIVKPTAKKIALLAASQGMLPKPQGVGLAGVYMSENPSSIMGYELYGELVGAPGWHDYSTGFTGTHWLQYSDRIA